MVDNLVILGDRSFLKTTALCAARALVRPPLVDGVSGGRTGGRAGGAWRGVSESTCVNKHLY